MHSIKFENVCKSFGIVGVLDNLNIDVHEGERLILLGPSGCGKSTILRLIAGLERVTSGNIYFGDKIVNDVHEGDRNVAMVFQNYALYPHMTVKDNITYALRAHKVDKSEIATRLKDALEMLRLEGLESRKPRELSGGQRQRVALARAIVKRSNYFLLDEPLSNLDAQLRHRARKELLKIHERYRQTFIYVTHDQVEAMTLGDRVALMHEGKLQMIDTPSNIFNKPANVFTARFIGAPSCNTVPAQYTDRGLHIDDMIVPLCPAWHAHIKAAGKTDFVFGLRPEHIELSYESTEGAVCVKISSVENYGSQKGAYFNMGSEEWVAMTTDNNFNVGDTVYFKPDTLKIHVFDSQTTDSIGWPYEER